MFRALRHRNFRLFFIGQGVSLIGTWMDQVATSWLVYRLTGSAFLLGVVGFASQIPSFILGPIAGVWADRWDKRRILVITQTLMMLEALALAILTLMHIITVHQIIALSLIFGLVTAIDMPTRQAFMVVMVEDKNDWSPAIGLNSALFNATRLIGPALAGVTIAAVGEGVCFLINAVSFLAVIAALIAMKVPHEAHVTSAENSQMNRLMEGIRYVRGSIIGWFLILLASLSLFGTPYMVLMPVFATKILHGGPSTMGILMGSTGAGALFGALYLTSRKSVRGLTRVIAWSTALFGIALFFFAQSHQMVVSMGLLAIVGFGLMTSIGASNIILQTIVDDDKRGRVMALYTMSLMGMVPLASLIGGRAAEIWGAPFTVGVGGVACVLVAGIYFLRLPALRDQIRPIYREKGILPTVPSPVLDHG